MSWAENFLKLHKREGGGRLLVLKSSLIVQTCSAKDLQVQKGKVQSSLFSHYKHVTYKGLVSIAPSGGITLVNYMVDLFLMWKLCSVVVF